MKVLVVEEEKQVVKKLEQALKSIDNTISIIATVPAIFSSAEWLQQLGIPDIILVSRDVIREQVFKTMPPADVKATVIFRVHADEYIFQAFRINSLEHLFPNGFFDTHTHGTALTMPAAVHRPSNGSVKTRNRFLVKQGQKFASVETEDIAYFFSEGRFIFFKTFDNQKFLVEYTLEELECMLHPQDFFRINRSLVVSFKSVMQIHPYFGNRLKLYLDPPMEKEIIVSREKVQGFKTWLGQ